MSVDLPQQRTTDPRDLVKAYEEAWNAHDGAGVAAGVTGSYVDPTLPGPISGDVLAATVDGLCAAFPDLRFVDEGMLVDGTTVTARWRMQGTNTGAPLPGAPAATGGTIDLPGVDVVTTEAGRVVDVVGYFDQATFLRQLGIQAHLSPADEWPVSWGITNRVDIGSTATPGAVTFTWIETEDVATLQRHTTDIVTALASEPGFIGFRAASVGNRHSTFTLWTSPEAAEAALARNAPHRAAMDSTLSGQFGSAGFTSIWSPYRVNNQFQACPSCGRLVQIPSGAGGADCDCGGRVETSSYV